MRGVFDKYSALIGREVRVESTDLTFTRGVLYCIDPESDSVVLLSQRKGEDDARSWSVQVFLGHGVAAIHGSDDAAATASLESILECLQVESQKDANSGGGIVDASEALEKQMTALVAFFQKVGASLSLHHNDLRNAIDTN